MELRGHVIPEPRKIPSTRVPLSWKQVCSIQGGLSGTVYLSDSRRVILIELKSQREIVSSSRGIHQIFSDGRLLHIPSLDRTAAWDERCSGVEGTMCAVPSHIRGRRAGPGDVGKSACFAKVKLISITQNSHSVWTRCGHQSHPSVTSKSDVPPRQPLDLAEVLAKLATVPDEPRSSQSLEKEFGVDVGRATTETKYTEVYGGGSGGGGGLPRRSDHAPTQHILHTHHEYPQLSLRRTGRRYEKIWLLFPRNQGAGSATHPLLQCGHLRSLRWVRVMVTGDFDEGRIGGSDRTRYSVRSTGRSSLGQRTVARTVRSRRPTRRSVAARRSFSRQWYREAAALEAAKKQRIGFCSDCPSLALNQTSLR